MTFNDWKAQAIGRHIDVDGAYGAQCVDVYLDYIVKVIGVSEWSSVSGWGDAAPLYPKANQNYFTKYDSTGIPQKGDVIFYGPTRTNSAGHVAIVDSADATGVNCIEQDGFNPSGSCYAKFRAWNGTCLGWQRPKTLVIGNVTPQGGTEVFLNIEEVKEAYRQMRGVEGTLSEMQPWVGQSKQRWIQLSTAETNSTRQQLADVRRALVELQNTPAKEVIKEVQVIVDRPVEVIKEVTVYTHDQETKDMITSIFNYFKGQYKTFLAYIKK